MGCENTGIPQPSLEKFYEGLEIELKGGLCLECYWSHSVAFLAHQGVLMANSALTTEIGQPGAHQELWEGFTTFLLREIVIPRKIPIILLGKAAGKFSGCMPTSYPLFELYHPAYASYKSTKSEPFRWDTKGSFSAVNKLLKDEGKTEIEWLTYKLHEFD